MYKCSDPFWDRVRAYKRDRNIPTLNDAVTDLLTTALDLHEKQMESSVYSQIGVKA